jgi:CheY-like chemotaxis protein
MTEAVQARIFEPFFTTKGLGEGTGLGLAAVYGMVQALGGEIRVRSAEGQGATFEIDLPAADGPVPAAPPAPPATGARVMVVEDDPAVRAVACQALAEAGYRVRVADGPAEALMLVGEAERIDVLVTDVVMPGMGGPELADVVRRGRPGLPVLYMSGYPAEEVEQRGVAASAVAFLPKPFTPAGLAAQVGEVLAGRAELGRSRMV